LLFLENRCADQVMTVAFILLLALEVCAFYVARIMRDVLIVNSHD